MSFPVLVLLGLSTFRITFAVTTDKLTAGLRLRVLRRFPPLVVDVHDEVGRVVPGAAQMRPRWPVILTTCDWCLAVWVALIIVAVAHAVGLVHGWTPTLLGWPAVAGFAGVLSDVVARLTR